MRRAVRWAAIWAASWPMACGSDVNHGSEGNPDAGPTPAEIFCTADMACEGGNQTDSAACVVQVGGERALAAVAGCTSQFDAVLTCTIAHSSCAAGHYTAGQACQAELDAYQACNQAATEPATTPATSDDVTAYCQASGDCQGASAIDYADCLVQGQMELDVAAAYGCSAEALVQCFVAQGQCVSGTYTAGSACEVLFTALDDCVNAASSLD
jgi:hypothetical protein